jgi:hypothetical protein
MSTTTVAGPRGGTKYILAINFLELIMNANYHRPLIQQSLNTSTSSLYFTCKFLGMNYQTKFYANVAGSLENPSQYRQALDLAIFSLNKAIMLKIDLGNQTEVEEAFSRPLEL